MKSHINEARFTKRIPTDTYAYEEYSLGAVVDATESGDDVLIEMRRQVSAAFAADLVEATERKEKPKKADKKTAKKEEKKDGKSKSKASAAVDEEEVGATDEEDDTDNDAESLADDETADDNTEDDSDDSSDDSEDSEDGEDSDVEEEETKPAKGKTGSSSKGDKSDKEEKGKKGFKKKPQVYTRGIDQHREIFSRVLRSVSPTWKESDVLKARAKKVSEALEGEKFLDENGEVLPEFKAEVKKRMTAKAK